MEHNHYLYIAHQLVAGTKHVALGRATRKFLFLQEKSGRAVFEELPIRKLRPLLMGILMRTSARNKWRGQNEQNLENKLVHGNNGACTLGASSYLYFREARLTSSVSYVTSKKEIIVVHVVLKSQHKSY